MQNIYKTYGAVKALTNAHFELNQGKIHALVGENGAGKSTLIKIIMGEEHAEAGTIKLDGNPVNITNSQIAQMHGIMAVHQEPMIFPDLSVAENIYISHANLSAVIRWNKIFKDATNILAKLDVKLNVRMPARGLTLATQQVVEIAKAISLNVRILILDEPTSTLSVHEVQQLFKIIRSLKEQGVAILFIGHRLEEVFDIADKITVFRDGSWVSSKSRSEATMEGVIHDMVGRDVKEFFVKDSDKSKIGDVLLSVRNFSKAYVFNDINFDIHRGEVLGFAGLVGSRRTDVGLALFGIEPADSGEIIFEGKNVKINSPEKALQVGIAYTTEDRHRFGLILPMSITANITLPLLQRYVNKMGLINRQKESDSAEIFKKRLSIATPSVQVAVRNLSGGNQQKVLLSKWLNANPKLLIMDEPTRG
ncbi:MAG: sugar ABC transporter ATP-binding protein, partial [Actinobacteria bacterium]|nr:sugar ABC transporter ATP-binding protein [Actinomycetota bacterium]